MDEFGKRLVSNVRVTKESALKDDNPIQEVETRDSCFRENLEQQVRKIFSVRKSSAATTSQDEVQMQKSSKKVE